MTDTPISTNILYLLSNDICSCTPESSVADSAYNTCLKIALIAMLFRLLVVVILLPISIPNSWAPYLLTSK